MRGYKPKKELDFIADYYRSGLSLRKIASITGKTHQSIAQILIRRKVKMREKPGRKPKEDVIEYKGLRYTWTAKGYWRCTKYSDRHNLARKIWEDNFGNIPQNFEVFYLDGNRYNLDIKNLGCASRSDRMKERLKDQTLKNVLYAYGCYGRLVRTMNESLDPSLAKKRLEKMWKNRRANTDPSASAKRSHEKRLVLYGSSCVKDPEATRKKLSISHIGKSSKGKKHESQ